MPTLAEIDAEIAKRNAKPSLVDIDAEIARRQSGRPSSTLDIAKGVGEAALTIGSSIIAEPAGGVAGAITSLLPGTAEGSGAGVSERVSQSMTFEPNTKEGRDNLQSVVKTLQPIAALLQSAEKISGDAGFDLAGPVGGAIGAALPTALAELLGIKGARGAKRIGGTEIAPPAKDLISTGESLKVPVFTTDVQPPTTFIGKFTQQLSEKLGPLGSGNVRAEQQIARQNVVEGLAKEFEVELDSPFAQEIVTSLNERSAKVLSEASAQRNGAVKVLDGFGEVPVDNTLSAIEAQIAKQTRLGDKADATLVTNLEKIKTSINGDFSLVKDIRTEVIDDLRALSRSEDRRAESSLRQVKKAIDDDLNLFAKTNDRKAAADWLASNRKFADEFSNVRETELKRILSGGEATPEKVLTILKGGKPSELKRMYTSLTPEGQSSARAAIIKDALDESGFARGDINPDRLTTALNKTNRKQAVNAFFTGQDKKQLDGLVRLLDATRRAQQSSVTPSTGIQAIPFLATGGTGFGMAVSPIATLAGVGSLSAIAKAYESKGFRNLLLKIANSKKGSKVETGLLELSVPLVISGIEAAKPEPEKIEKTQ